MSPRDTAGQRADSLSRIVFPGRTIIVAAIVVVAVVGAFVLGRTTASTKDEALVAATASVSATAVVEERAVVPESMSTGTVTEGKTQRIAPTVLPETPIVTRQLLTPGSKIVPGAVLGAIADTPVFVLPGPLPLYRDLVGGSEGDDVAALQAALAKIGYPVTVSGRVEWGTIAAVIDLFGAAGYTLPTRPVVDELGVQQAPDTGADSDEISAATEMEPVIPAAAFVALEGEEATVLSVAEVAEFVTEETPMATVRVGSRLIVTRVDVVSAAHFHEGVSVNVMSGGSTFVGKVQSINAFDTGSDGRTPGYDVLITTKAPEFDDIKTGAQLQVKPITEAERTIAVPVTAIRHDAEGDYVLVQHNNGETKRTATTVIRTAGGWAAVDAPELNVGDTVVL